MGFSVYDFRTDVKNIVVTPEIRGRFLRMEPGQVANRHSHDLGHEIFLVLEGQCEFEIAGERAVLGPGQACFARRDQMHQVRVVGDAPMTMYLSVTPHLEPTHTTWTADPGEGGQKEPPRYQTWKDPRRDGIPEPDESPATLADRHLAALLALAETTQKSAAAQEAGIAALKRALASGDAAAARTAVDGLWAELYPLFRAVSTLSEAWNALAPAAAPLRRE
ncbi:MAG TPA: cupin domain-containing protein [Chloroflexota bacterium]|nr:cupin domain-containing protein [Chloroflexota bacterium]